MTRLKRQVVEAAPYPWRESRYALAKYDGLRWLLVGPGPGELAEGEDHFLVVHAGESLSLLSATGEKGRLFAVALA